MGHGQTGAIYSGTLVLAVGVLLVALSIGAAVVTASLVQRNAVENGDRSRERVQAAIVLCLALSRLSGITTAATSIVNDNTGILASSVVSIAVLVSTIVGTALREARHTVQDWRGCEVVQAVVVSSKTFCRRTAITVVV
ncbi:hypothetical protein BDV97DRAFT_357297 [Delphinella strobiligena]|nr:hypothetical protein BDV97DRAFT_357297 [Delphinella strobiligena]